MCGRFVSVSPIDVLVRYFDVDEVIGDAVAPSWNVAPTMDVYAVGEGDGRRRVRAMRWGLVPHWAKDLSIGSRLINARAETLLERPAFADAFTRRRCIIPADGFYEWRRDADGRKGACLIRRPDRAPLAFAGLWGRWRPAPGVCGARAAPRTSGADIVMSCSIVTTRANGVVAGLHDRMPVVLPEAAWASWLDPAVRDVAALRRLLRPAPDDLLEIVDASPLVNDVRNDGPHLAVP